MTRSIWIGFDPREVDAFYVTKISLMKFNRMIPIRGLVLDELRKQGLYSRPTERRDGRLWDVISEAPMATEFAVSRFLVPHLAKAGWALFMDSDMLVRENIARLFEEAERQSDKALVCVQHNHKPIQTTKMDGQVQTVYPRKNWSSVMLFNCDHPANAALTVEMVNTLPGRDLHRFCWLNDADIGSIGPEWNFLVGHSDPTINPKIVHFTDGIPSMPGYENVPYADEWRAELHRLAA